MVSVFVNPGPLQGANRRFVDRESATHIAMHDQLWRHRRLRLPDRQRNVLWLAGLIEAPPDPGRLRQLLRSSIQHRLKLPNTLGLLRGEIRGLADDLREIEQLSGLSITGAQLPVSLTHRQVAVIAPEKRIARRRQCAPASQQQRLSSHRASLALTIV
jgi:hypothetical protein